MRRLAERNATTDTSSERGAVAVIVAVLLVALIGLGAYVIDVGALYEEKRDLQNGADAAVLAIATDCAASGVCTKGAAQPEAEKLAGLNSNDGQATVLMDDIDFDLPNQTVTVTVRTKDASDGNGEIDFVLAPVLGNDSAAVQASATASWGAPGGAAVIPLIISSCEWEDATANGTVFDVELTIFLHGSASSPPPCSFGPGQDIDGDGTRAEGGFGWLETATDCTASINADGYVQGQPGNGNPNSLGCEPGDLLGKTLLLPIFDDIPDVGNPCGGPPGQNCYHVYGFGAFHITGFYFSGGQWKEPNPAPCNGNRRCIRGYFTEFVTLEDLNAGGGPQPDLGVYAVGLSG